MTVRGCVIDVRRWPAVVFFPGVAHHTLCLQIVEQQNRSNRYLNPTGRDINYTLHTCHFGTVLDQSAIFPCPPLPSLSPLLLFIVGTPPPLLRQTKIFEGK